jgi:hypothetical protein
VTVKRSHYEERLAEYSDHLGAIALLKLYRPYLEMIPSMRRPSESVISIPLPLIRIRQSITTSETSRTYSSEVLRLPCDVAILMCDPEWKIKTGVEIFVFIYRPQEDFSDLLGRWRQTQILLDKGYEWLMPLRHQHILSEGADEIHPLFVLFPDTPTRIKRGLQGTHLPFVTEVVQLSDEETIASSEASATEILDPETLNIED